jgi:hypothetical protein
VVDEVDCAEAGIGVPFGVMPHHVPLMLLMPCPWAVPAGLPPKRV